MEAAKTVRDVVNELLQIADHAGLVGMVSLSDAKSEIASGFSVGKQQGDAADDTQPRLVTGQESMATWLSLARQAAEMDMVIQQDIKKYMRVAAKNWLGEATDETKEKVGSFCLEVLGIKLDENIIDSAPGRP